MELQVMIGVLESWWIGGKKWELFGDFSFLAEVNAAFFYLHSP
jgi:hypothetical protein